MLKYIIQRVIMLTSQEQTFIKGEDVMYKIEYAETIMLENITITKVDGKIKVTKNIEMDKDKEDNSGL